MLICSQLHSFFALSICAVLSRWIPRRENKRKQFSQWKNTDDEESLRHEEILIVTFYCCNIMQKEVPTNYNYNSIGNVIFASPPCVHFSSTNQVNNNAQSKYKKIITTPRRSVKKRIPAWNTRGGFINFKFALHRFLILFPSIEFPIFKTDCSSSDCHTFPLNYRKHLATTWPGKYIRAEEPCWESLNHLNTTRSKRRFNWKQLSRKYRINYLASCCLILL